MTLSPIASLPVVATLTPETGRGEPLDPRQEKDYGKREPRPLQRTGNGVGTARFAPPCHGCQMKVIVYDPDPSHPGRGQLLSGVRRQQQDKGQSDKQGENKPAHGYTPFTFCAVPTRTTRGNHGKGSLPQTHHRFNRYPAGKKAPRSLASRLLH